METSKKILLASYIIGIFLVLVTIAGVYFGYDVSVIGTITGLVFGEISVSNAFYFNKAKRENEIKIALKVVEKMPEKFSNTSDVATLISSVKN